MVKGTDLIKYNGVATPIKDIPDKETRVMLGYGHFNSGRSVVPAEKEWPFNPGNCEVADDPHCVKWINNNTVLVCTGCGLDCT
jgi:hypothetical protein